MIAPSATDHVFDLIPGPVQPKIKKLVFIASLSTCHVYCFSVHLSRLLLLCPLVTSITSLSTCHVYCFSIHLSRLLLLCPLVTSIASLSTCQVYCFSVHLSRLLLLCPLVTSIASLFTCHVYCFSVHLSRLLLLCPHVTYSLTTLVSLIFVCLGLTSSFYLIRKKGYECINEHERLSNITLGHTLK